MIIYDKDKKILFIPERDDVVLLEWKDIYQKGFRDGYKEGYDEAYEDNYQSGYTDGYEEGIVACHVDATSITLDVPSVIVDAGKADVIVGPADADVELIFTSSDPETATIDENGNITVLDDGEVTFCVEDLETGLKDCKTVSVEVPVLSISPVFFEDIPYSGATYVINVTANQPWSIINYYQDILITDITGGTGSGVINVTVAPAGEGGVIADLIIRPQSGNEASAHFWQNPTPYFRVSPLSIEAAATGGTYSIRVESNYDWEATNIPSWISLSRTSGHSNADISAVVSENTGGTRTTSIKFSQIETGATLEHTVVISQESGEQPYFRIIPTGNIWFEKSGGTINLIIDTNMDIPWRIQARSDDPNHSLTVSPVSGTGYQVVELTTNDVGCDTSLLVVPGSDTEGQFQNYLDIYTGSTLYENKLVLQKTWLWAIPVIYTEILNQPASYPATGGTYTLVVNSYYGPTTFPTVSHFDRMLGTATYSGSTYNQGTFEWEHYFSYTVPANTGSTITDNYGGVTQRMTDSPCDDNWEYENYYVESQDGGATPPTPTQVRVQDLIAEGYANVVPPGGEYKAGTYIEILPTCPYLPDQIINLADVALNQEEITAGTRNTIVWNQTLPTGWTDQDIVDIYSGQTISFPPRGEEFWDVKSGITSLELTFTGDSYVTSDYTWGSYNSEGVFAPRWNQNRQGEYVAKGWLQTPATVIVNFTSSFSSVSQVMFTQMKSTTSLTINQQSGTFACHDVTGMFEGDSAMVTLNIIGAFNYGTWRTQHNVFDGCTALTGIPYSTSWTREHANNTIYPHFDGVRGSANCHHMFRGCNSLTYLGPTFNMGAISLSGCTYDGQNQAALSSTLFECPSLADVRIIHLNNNDWNFADSSTYTYIPAMNAASIEYLLNNVEDVTSQGGHSVTFASTYKNSVSASAIAYAQNKGWNVIWAGDTPTGNKVGITYEIPESNYPTNITYGSAPSFSDATLDSTTPINIKSSYYTGRYVFTDAGTHIIEFTPTGDTIGQREFAYTCVKITDVVLPEGITTLGAECFSGCRMLTGVTLCNSLTTIGAQVFMNCSAMTEFHITSGVTMIDDEAFRNCSALTGITIPSSVTTLGADAFEGCSGLTMMEFEGTTPPTPGNALALGNLTYAFPIYVPASSVSAYQTAFPNYASRITSK